MGFAAVLAALVAAVVLAGAAEPARSQSSCLGAAVTHPGTPGDDVITGTSGDDVIDAIGGNDVVDGGAGDDRICLGSGIDVAQGGDGNDELEGATEEDLLVGDHLNGSELGSGDDEVAGGDGDDVVIGDASNEDGNAAGEGDDKLNGGAGNDLVVGDAFSNAIAFGTGDDDIDLGPGTDISAGDAIVGTPGTAGARASTRGFGSQPLAVGSGGDEINGQTGDDVGAGDAAGFLRSASTFCGRRLARQIFIAQVFGGMDPDELADEVENLLKLEFDDDLLVGNCLSLFQSASGGGMGLLNGGAEPGRSEDGGASGDVLVGGSAGTAVSVANADRDHDMLLEGKGDGNATGDNALVSVVGGAPFEFTITAGKRLGATTFDNTMRGDFNEDGVVDAADYVLWRSFGSTTEVEVIHQNGNRAARGLPAGKLSGGGKDTVRGGGGADALEGGPKDDDCKGGGGDEDTALTNGPYRCEDVNGVP